jgi:hypothetical protein
VDITLKYTNLTKLGQSKTLSHAAGDRLVVQILDDLPSSDIKYILIGKTGEKLFTIIPSNKSALVSVE